MPRFDVAPLSRSGAAAATVVAGPAANVAARPAANVAARPAASRALRPAIALIGAAWLVTVLLQVTGHAGALHHHELIEGPPAGAAPPLWLAISLFVLAWQLMTASMMLPASLRAVGAAATSRFVRRPEVALIGFLAAYFLVWTGFGLAAFAGDMGLHRLVDMTPWLEARPWLIEAGVLALAGAYQLLPLRRRALEACRHPRSARWRERGDLAAGIRVGFDHALDCLASSWALMLLMFAAGVANLAWMVAIAAVMAYEVLGRHGARFGTAVGLVLLAIAGLATSGLSLAF
jgi:predicted metal-binding membrane protein